MGRVVGMAIGVSALRAAMADSDGRCWICDGGSSSLPVVRARNIDSDRLMPQPLRKFDIPASSCLFSSLKNPYHIKSVLLYQSVNCYCSSWAGTDYSDFLNGCHGSWTRSVIKHARVVRNYLKEMT